MAGRSVWCRGLRVAGGLFRRPMQQAWRRSAHHESRAAPESANMWLIGAAAGATLIAAYQVSRSDRAPKPLVEQKKEAYAKTGAVHPEAVAEEQLTPQESSPPPPAGTETPTEPPPPPTPLPDSVPYVLVGGGTAAFAAAKAIREKDPTAKVLIVTDEAYTPYSRPPLSKQLWASEDHNAARQLRFTAPWSGGKLVDVFYKTEFCAPGELMTRDDGGIAVLTSTKVVGLDTKKNAISLDSGHVITYDKCLLATGGRPRTLPLFDNAPDTVKKNISVYRKIPDFLTLDQLLEKKESVLVVGGGFLGTELAVGMATRYKNGLKVYQLFPEAGNLGLVLPPALAAWTLEKVKKEGVEVFPNINPTSVESNKNKIKVTTSSGIELVVDHVVVAVGLYPNTQLAQSGRLETDSQLGGIRVNSELQACSNVWVAGDVSCFYDPHLGRRRVEHHDHAQVSGKLAGYNMAGDNQTFDHQSMFWSDVGPDVGFEATGIVDSNLPTCGIYPKKEGEEGGMPIDDYSKGVVFYLSKEERRIVGVLTWNLFGKMDVARKVIAEERKEADIGEIVGQFELQPQPQPPQ